jgi:hypothetical protein
MYLVPGAFGRSADVGKGSDLGVGVQGSNHQTDHSLGRRVVVQASSAPGAKTSHGVYCFYFTTGEQFFSFNDLEFQVRHEKQSRKWRAVDSRSKFSSYANLGLRASTLAPSHMGPIDIVGLCRRQVRFVIIVHELSKAFLERHGGML